MPAIATFITLIHSRYSSSARRLQLKWQQSCGKSSVKALDSPTLSHVSVTQRKSNPQDVKKSYKTKVGGGPGSPTQKAQDAVIHPTPAGTRRAGAVGLEHLLQADDRYQPGVESIGSGNNEEYILCT